jgi:hypothetical protein
MKLGARLKTSGRAKFPQLHSFFLRVQKWTPGIMVVAHRFINDLSVPGDGEGHLPTDGQAREHDPLASSYL